MLVNDAELGYRESGGSIFTDLPRLKEVPEMDIELEKVENTCPINKSKQYENGIGDASGITYRFKYDNSRADCPYRVVRAAQDAGEVSSFQETLTDGATTEFDGQVSIKGTGGGINGMIEFNLVISLQSGLTVAGPT